MHGRRWSLMLGIALTASAVCIGLHAFVPSGPLGDVTYLLPVFVAPLIGLVGTLRQPHGSRLVPTLLTAGLALSALGDLIWMSFFWYGDEPDVSAADPVYLLSYVGICGALLVLTLVRRHDRLRIDAGAVIDALTVIVVSVLLLWSISVHDIVVDDTVTPYVRFVWAMYPVADAVLLALTVRVLTQRRTRKALGLPFAIGAVCWLTADLGYYVFEAAGTVSMVLDLGWMVGGTLMATAAWRPQSVPTPEELTEPAPFATLSIAILPLLVPPALLTVATLTDGDHHAAEAVVGMTLLAALTFARTARLLRSEQVARAELVHARDAAVAGSRAKSDFLATMSHEIRTPMNGVIGLTHLMLQTELDPRQQQYAEGIRTAGNALLAVINDVLDFSKIEAGHLQLEEIDFDLGQVVEQVADLVTEPAHAKSLELLAYCDPGLPVALRGDPARLRQVLLNLTSNAVKFTATGEVVVRAHLDTASPNRPMIRFEVVDTGVGIGLPDGDASRLFEPFAQADASTTREFGGTGLGLAICHQLVTAMGGTIGVDSEPGKGSTFWFTVPLTHATDASVVPAVDTELLTGRRALVVDHHASHREILENQLTAWGMSVTAAHDAADPLRLVTKAARRSQPYDVAIIDMETPDNGGLELARRLHEAPALAGAGPAVLAVGGDVTPEQAEAAGIAATMTRPVLLSRLQSTLQKVFRARSEPASRGTVLVVEDGGASQVVASGMLQHLGYTVDLVKSGPEALARVRDVRYDAVLMDVQMAHMDGYEASTQIRRAERTSPRVPIIAMTGGATEAHRLRCLDAGMDDYIPKPITLATLEQALTRWVKAA